MKYIAAVTPYIVLKKQSMINNCQRVAQCTKDLK